MLPLFAQSASAHANDWEGFAVDNARSLRRRFRNE